MTPKCCQRCLHLNKETILCKKGFILPFRKGSCKKQKLRILARFAQFLKDNNAADGYMLQGVQRKLIKVFPKEYIWCAGFSWLDSIEGGHYWRDLHNRWNNILKEEYNID